MLEITDLLLFDGNYEISAERSDRAAKRLVWPL
jgi:hypothetical protein